MTHIDLDKVSLTFRVRRLGPITLKEYLLREIFHKSKNTISQIQALQEVSLNLKEGSRVGLIGHNGAGKSTLLRTMAGVYPPCSGHIFVEGKISSLFDLLLGFEGDASGWDNIIYQGCLQGKRARTIRAKMPAIAEFSELGDHLDLPVRCYSAGMVFRLAFSIATAIEPEILLLDEVFSVGDLTFQEKARARIKKLISKARILVMANHDLKVLAEICDTGVWLEHGRVRKVGPIVEVISAYTSHAFASLSQAA